MKYILIMLLICISTSAFATMNVWVDHGSIKVRQQGDYTGTGQQAIQNISLKAAKNEFEPFQIFIYANGENLTGVDVTVSDLTDGNGHTITSNITEGVDSDVRIFKQGYMSITTAGRADYTTGLWPDPLFPKKDIYYNEVRTTFPFPVTSGNVQGVWVDIGVPPSATAGTYTGTYTVTADGKTPVTGTVTLQVWDFALPSTATQKNMWMLSESDLGLGFYGYGSSSQSNTWIAQMMNLLGKSFLYHRISLNTKASGVQFTAINSTTGAVTWYSWWNTAWQSLLNGTAITSGSYSGAKLPTYNMELAHTTSSTYDANATMHTKYLQDWFDHFTANGWTPMQTLFGYGMDEPGSAAGGTGADGFTGYHYNYRGVTNMYAGAIQAYKSADMAAVNTSGLGQWKNYFTTWYNGPTGDPIIMGLTSDNYYDSPAVTSHDSNGMYCPVDVHYEWTDTQGSSYKKARENYPDYAGWPTKYHWSYVSNMNMTLPQIDLNTNSPAYWTRAIGWIDWTYRNTGNLYYDVNISWGYNTGQSRYATPYVNTFQQNVNGQDTSVYPGVASKTGRTYLPASTPEIGGTHDIPIESIKIKNFRDSQEDMEYMHILRNQGKTAAVDAVVNTLYGSAWSGGHGKYYSLTGDVSIILTAREALANMIVNSTPVFKGFKIQGIVLK